MGQEPKKGSNNFACLIVLKSEKKMKVGKERRMKQSKGNNGEMEEGGRARGKGGRKGSRLGMDRRGQNCVTMNM